MSRRGSRTLRQRGSRMALDLRNAIRRVVVRTSAGADWGVLGYEYEDPDEGTVAEGGEDPEVPAFQGIGIYARPVGDRAEALMLHVGAEADHPVLAAVRDEDGRRAYVSAFGEVSPGEVAIFNGQGTARVLIKTDGSVEVSGLGVAQALANATYRGAEDTYLGLVAAAMTALGTDPLLAGTTKTACAAAGTATGWAAFLAGAASYLTTVLKGE